MTKSIGVTMDFTGTNKSVGVFLRDIVASQLGDKIDLFIFESGTQNVLGPQGLYLKIDEKSPELKLWSRTSDKWKRSAFVVSAAGPPANVLEVRPPLVFPKSNVDLFVNAPDKVVTEISFKLAIFRVAKQHGTKDCGRRRVAQIDPDRVDAPTASTCQSGSLAFLPAKPLACDIGKILLVRDQGFWDGSPLASHHRGGILRDHGHPGGDAVRLAYNATPAAR